MRSLLLLVFAIFILGNSAAAQPTSVRLTMHASPTNHGRGVTIDIRTVLDEAPSASCDITIEGGLSTVGESAPLPKGFRIVTRRSTSKKRSRFFYVGTPIKATESRQTQLNIFATYSCPGDNVVIESNYDASNVSATSGVTRAEFTRQLRRFLR